MSLNLSRIIASTLLVSCVVFQFFGRSEAKNAELNIVVASERHIEKKTFIEQELAAQPRIFEPAAVTCSTLVDNSTTLIAVNANPVCKYKPTVNSTKFYSAVSAGSLYVWQNSVLNITEIATASLSFLVIGTLNFDTSSTVNIFIDTASSAGWNATYQPWSITLIEATSCVTTTVTLFMPFCPGNYSCVTSWVSTSTSCKLILTLTPTKVFISKNYYTLQLNMDCAFYTPSWFQSLVSMYYSKPVANAFVLDPMFCGSVYQSFRCQSYTAALAETICDPFYLLATKYNSTVWNLLNVNYGWKLKEPFKPVQSNFGLHALFAIFAAPVAAVLIYGLYKERVHRQRRAQQQELGGVTTDSEK